MSIEKFKKEVSYIILSITVGMIVTVMVNTIKVYSNDKAQSISNEVLRFHVLANSNSEEDQKLKILVKDKTIEKFKDVISAFKSKEESVKGFEEKLKEIENYAQKVINDEGYSYKIVAEVGKSFFPTKTYGDVTLPKGEYLGLRLIIGNGTGENWWCVMFPPLCYVDEAIEGSRKGIIDDTDLEKILGTENYKIIVEDTLEYRFKFKIVEMFQNIKL